MLEQLAYLAEVVGGVVIPVTLIFLSLQLSQNNKMLRSTATQGAHDQITAIYHPLLSDPSLAELYLKGGARPSDLTAAETVRIYSWYITTFFQVQNWYFQTTQGAMRTELLDRWAQVICNLYRAFPGVQDFWKQRRYIYSPEFVAWLENDVFTRDMTPGYRPLGANLEAGSAWHQE